MYNAIFRRKSVRKLQPEVLPQDKLRLIEEYSGNIKPLFGDMRSKLSILNGDQISLRFAISAPHYAAFYAPPSKRGLLSAGYMLQQLDLCLSAAGLGSCYLGMAKPRKEYLTHEGLEYLLMLAFGSPAVPSRRENTSEFDRKPLPDISEPGVPGELLEPVRLAPSAINAQPWFFTQDGRDIQVWRAKPRSFKALLSGDLSFADLGIALCHLRIAAEHAGLSCGFDFERRPAPIKGFEPVCTTVMS